MKEFAIKHPFLTVLFLVPTVIGGVVGVVQAIGAPKRAATSGNEDADPILGLAASISRGPAT